MFPSTIHIQLRHAHLSVVQRLAPATTPFKQKRPEPPPSPLPTDNMASGFDEEELHISLSPSQIRRRSQQHGAASDAAASAAGHHELQPPVPGAVNIANMGPPVDTTAPLREKIKTEQRIGAYKIIKTLGEGSFGKVKLAIHNGTGQQVALKIIARKKLISRDMAGRVEREIEYLQLLRHPHIIKLCVTYLRRRLLASGLSLTQMNTDTLLSRPPTRSSWSLNMQAESFSTI